MRQLTEHARTVGWDVYTPAARTRVRAAHQPPYVFTDDEVRRLFGAIDAQRMSSYSNKAIVDPVLFRVLYGTGLRISEALKLAVSDVDTRAGTLRIRDSKNGAGRTIPMPGRLKARENRLARQCQSILKRSAAQRLEQGLATAVFGRRKRVRSRLA